MTKETRTLIMIAIGDILGLRVQISGNKLFRHRNPDNADRLDKLANRMMEDRKAIVRRLFQTRHVKP